MGGGRTLPKVTLMLAEAEFPATSAPLTVITLTPERSEMLQAKLEPLSVADTPLQERAATPERLSLAEPVSVSAGVLTVVPFAGLVMLICGSVWSKFTDTGTVDVFPAWSVAAPLYV
jgi:hypothetical protein